MGGEDQIPRSSHGLMSQRLLHIVRESVGHLLLIAHVRLYGMILVVSWMIMLVTFYTFYVVYELMNKSFYAKV